MSCVFSVHMTPLHPNSHPHPHRHPLLLVAAQDPIVLGVEVLEGTLRLNTPLHIPQLNLDVGRVTQLEINHRVVDKAKKGTQVTDSTIVWCGDLVFGGDMVSTILRIHVFSMYVFRVHVPCG